ncbi:efflux RND transporter permease subunit [Vibrio sp. M60_M31a]
MNRSNHGTILFIDRPVFAWALAILTMLAGGHVPDELASVRSPNHFHRRRVAISARHPARTPQKRSKIPVTQVIEQNMTGLDYLRVTFHQAGSDAFGNATVRLTFDSEADPDIAQGSGTKQATDCALTSLPSEVQSQGIVVEKSSTPFLLVVALYSEDPDYTQNDIADYVVSNDDDPISRIRCWIKVQAFGAQHVRCACFSETRWS